MIPKCDSDKMIPRPAWRIFDLLVWGIAAIVSFLAWVPTLRTTEPQHWYVSPDGSDIFGNGSRTRPWGSIQFACDQLASGDTVHVLPGVYCERVHIRSGGRSNSPVTIQADPPGRALITAACPLEQCRKASWHDEGGGIYSTPIGWPIHMARVNGSQLYRVPWGGVDYLRELAKREHACGAFWSEEGRLYIGLPGGTDPKTVAIDWHHRVPSPREWGEFKSANVWVEADHVVISGLRFDFGLGSAIRVWNGAHLTVEDCEFAGCRVGVQARAGIKPANHLNVTRCWYHHSPQSDWRRKWMAWAEVYAAYSSSTLCGASDCPIRIRDNLVTDFGDGVQISPRVNQEEQGTAEIEGNWLAFGTDDAFEFDGEGHNIVVKNNVVIDVHVGLSFSPLSEGPVKIERNLFWNPISGLNGSQLKFLPPEGFRGRSGRIQGIRIQDNLFCGEWLSWRSEIAVKDVVIENNLFNIDHNCYYINQQLVPMWHAGISEYGNIYSTPRDATHSTVPKFLAALRNDETLHRFSESIQSAEQMISNRPGPRWLNWEDYPSTRRLLTLTQNR